MRTFLVTAATHRTNNGLRRGHVDHGRLEPLGKIGEALRPRLGLSRGRKKNESTRKKCASKTDEEALEERPRRIGRRRAVSDLARFEIKPILDHR